MQFKMYTDVHEFYKDTYGVLMRHEAQNLIPLGNIIIGHEGKDTTDWRDPANWFMSTISDANGIQLTAICISRSKLSPQTFFRKTVILNGIF